MKISTEIDENIIAIDLQLSKGTVFFFFPEKVRWPFNQSKSKIVYFFFSKIRKKKIQSAKVGVGPFFFLSKTVFFFVFFFSCKSSQCHSFNRSKICIFFFCRWKKKIQPFHSINRFSPKMCKTWTFSEKKNTVPLMEYNRNHQKIDFPYKIEFFVGNINYVIFQKNLQHEKSWIFWNMEYSKKSWNKKKVALFGIWNIPGIF